MVVYTSCIRVTASGIDLIVIGGSKTKWTTRMTHYERIRIYTRSVREMRGRKIIIIAKEHITRCRESKMFDTGTYANHKNNKTGAEVHTTEKGSFSFFSFFFLPYIKNKTKHLYCVFVYAQSDTLTWEYRISYLEHANKIVQRKKKSNQWFLHFTLNS
jgi:hypothetical protein